jgi:hypothetical protein
MVVHESHEFIELPARHTGTNNNKSLSAFAQQ